jgi:hypothetical protein
VRVQLSFEGGPWDSRLLDTEVTTAPEFVTPDDTQAGAYWRTEQQGGSAVVAYEWSPDGTALSRRASRASWLGEHVSAICVKRVRFGVDVVGAVAALVLAIVTLFSRAWIEGVFRFDPDRGSGALEWAVVFGLAAISIGLALAARQQWRRLSAAA